MRLAQNTLTASLLQAAISAHRCRMAARGADPQTERSLLRAADRYSQRVAMLADQLAAGDAP